MIALVSQTEASTTSSWVRIAFPEGESSDDVIILHTVSRGSINNITGLTKFEEVVSGDLVNTFFFGHAKPYESYYISSSLQNIAAKMMRFSGAKLSGNKGIHAYGTSTTGGTSTNSIVCKSVDYTERGLVLFFGGMLGSLGSTNQWASVQGYTEYYDYQLSNYSMIAVSKELTTAPGTTESVTLSNQDSSKTQRMASLTLVLAQGNSQPTLTLTSPSNQTLTEGSIHSISRNNDFGISITADDTDENDTLQYTILRNTTTLVPYTSISKNTPTLYTIPHSSLLIGNNPITVKVKDNNNGETSITFTIYVNPNLPIGYSCLNDLKPHGYNKSTLSLSEIINHIT